MVSRLLKATKLPADVKNAITKMSRCGKIVGDEIHFAVNYRHGNDGRQYASAPSLQRLRSSIRRALAGDKYIDLDIENAFPTILLQEMEGQGLSVPRLRQYVENRPAMIADMMSETGFTNIEFKTVCIAILHFGSAKNAMRAEIMRARIQSENPLMSNKEVKLKMKMEKPDKSLEIKVPASLRQLEEEIRVSAKALWKMTAFADLRKIVESDPKPRPNPFGTFISMICRRRENSILMAAVSFLEQNGFVVACLIYDGMLVEIRIMTAKLFEDLSDHCFKESAMRVKFIAKPFVMTADDEAVIAALEAPEKEDAEEEAEVLPSLLLDDDAEEEAEEEKDAEVDAEEEKDAEEEAEEENDASQARADFTSIMEKCRDVEVIISNVRNSVEQGKHYKQRIAAAMRDAGVPEQQRLLSENVVETLNIHFAVVTHMAKPVVFEEYRNATEHFFCLRDTNNLMIAFQRYSTKAFGAGDTSVDIMRFWLKHPNCRSFDRVVFRPQDDHDVKYDYNLWRGFEISYEDSIEGDIEPWISHIRDEWCKGDTVLPEYLFSWFAHLFQRPGVNMMSVPVLTGGQGAGKGCIITWFIAKILGSQTYHYCTDIQNIVSGFSTANMKTNLLTFMDEAVYAGDKRIQSQMKSLITENKRRFEEKHVNAIAIDNFSNFIMATNQDTAVRMEGDNRRYIPIEVSNKWAGPDTPEKKAYFDKLHAVDVRAVAHFLYTRDISNFNPLELPQSKTGREQKVMHFLCYQAFIEDFLRVGYSTLHKSEVMIGALGEDDAKYEALVAKMQIDWTIAKPVFYDMYNDFCRNAGQRFKYTLPETVFFKHVHAMCPSVKTGGRVQIMSMRHRTIVFPCIKTARKEFERIVVKEKTWEWDDNEECLPQPPQPIETIPVDEDDAEMKAAVERSKEREVSARNAEKLARRKRLQDEMLPPKATDTLDAAWARETERPLKKARTIEIPRAYRSVEGTLQIAEESSMNYKAVRALLAASGERDTSADGPFPDFY